MEDSQVESDIIFRRNYKAEIIRFGLDLYPTLWPMDIGTLSHIVGVSGLLV